MPEQDYFEIKRAKKRGFETEKEFDVIKIIIAGSRDFNNYDLLKEKCDKILFKFNRDEIEIVSGGARGCDRLGEIYAIDNNYKLTKFLADWDGLGKRAGYIRNQEMANYSDYLIAFWNGNSRGTLHMIEIARKQNLKTRIINYEI